MIRHYGRWIAAVVVLVLFGLLVASIVTNPRIDHATISHYQFSRVILEGLWKTVELSLLAETIGILLGIAFAVMRLSKNPVLATVSWVYVWFFRGTPILVQILFWGNLGLLFQRLRIGIPFTHYALVSADTNNVVTLFVASIIALSLNEGAYMAEIVRGGIIAVPDGQSDAARALGMTSWQVTRRVVLPQAMRVIVPPTGNQFISMLKTTSLVSVIAGGDLLSRAENVSSVNLRTVELLVVASAWYLVLTSIASLAQYYVERHFARSGRRGVTPTPFRRLLAGAIARRA